MMKNAIRRSRLQEVPEVDPTLLRETFLMVKEWNEKAPDNLCEVLSGPVLFGILDQIEIQLRADPLAVVALFQRAVALSALRDEAVLPAYFFENGLPGRNLCAAASTAIVHHDADISSGSVWPYFDQEEILAACRNQLN